MDWKLILAGALIAVMVGLTGVGGGTPDTDPTPPPDHHTHT